MDKIVSTALTVCSLGIIIGLIMKMQEMPYGHTVSLYCFLGFAALYPIQFFLMRDKNAFAYVRFVIIWGVCLLYLAFMFTGGWDFLPL